MAENDATVIRLEFPQTNKPLSDERSCSRRTRRCEFLVIGIEGGAAALDQSAGRTPAAQRASRARIDVIVRRVGGPYFALDEVRQTVLAASKILLLHGRADLVIR